MRGLAGGNMSSLEACPEVSKDLMLSSICSLGCLQLEMGAISSHSTACLLSLF